MPDSPPPNREQAATARGDEVLSPYVEDHSDPDDQPCRQGWCCGCPTHPIGKPWGWNHHAWEKHWEKHREQAHPEGTTPPEPTSTQGDAG